MASHEVVPDFVKGLFDKLLTDNIVVCLMEPGFIFNKDVHKKYSDIFAFEIPEGNGYLQKNKSLTNKNTTITGNVILLTSDSPEWQATGGNIPAVKSACFVNTSHPDEEVLSCITYDSEYTTPEGTGFMVSLPNGIFSLTIET